MKKLFLKISQYSQENTDAGFSFNKVAGLKNTYFEKHQQPAASGSGRLLQNSLLKEKFWQGIQEVEDNKVPDFQ